MSNPEAATRGRTYLFVGDSITDAGRFADPEELGTGYVRLLAEHFAAYEPTSRVINRGVSGDTSALVVDRIDADVLAPDADVISLYIGVNDTWRRYDSNTPTTADQFEENYRFILDQISATRPAIPVILVIPFVTDVNEERARYHEDLDEKVERIHALAREFDHPLIDTEALISTAYEAGHTPESIAPDGVHPSTAGHRLLADAWLEVFRSSAIQQRL